METISQKICRLNNNAAKKHRPANIQWDKIKVTFVMADKQNPNTLNPYSNLSPEERKDGALYLSSKIWKKE